MPQPFPRSQGNSVKISNIKDFLASMDCQEEFFINLNFSMSEPDLEYFINWLMEKSFWAASYKALDYKLNYSNHTSHVEIPPEAIKKILPLLERSSFSKEYKRSQILLLLKNKDWFQQNLIPLIESTKFTTFSGRELIDFTTKTNFVWALELVTQLLESKTLIIEDKKYLLNFLKNNNFDFKQKNSILLVGATNQENLELISSLLHSGALASARIRQTFIESIYKNNPKMFELYETALINEGGFNAETIEAVINSCISSLNHAWLTNILSSSKNSSYYKTSFIDKNKSLSLVLSLQESYEKHGPESPGYEKLKIEVEKLIVLLIENNLISTSSTHKGLPAIFKNCSDDFKDLINKYFIPYFEKTEPTLITKNILELIAFSSPSVTYWIEAIVHSTQKGEDILNGVLSQKSEEHWPSLLLHHLEELKAACSKKEKLELEKFIPSDETRLGKIIKI